MSVFATIGELTSMAPIAGGQYYWVAILGPESCRRLLSYLTAWMTFIGWQAVTASFGYLIGTVIQALAAFAQPTYTPTAWQGLLLYWAAILFATTVNTLGRRALGGFESTLLVFHIFGFLGVLIPLLYLGPHEGASIYTTFLNAGGWPTEGLSFIVGLSGSTFALIGADSAIHMCEEVRNAAVTVPRALLTGIFLNGLLGFSMVLALIGCSGDLEAMFEAAETTYPFLGVLLQATNSVAGSTIMASIIVIVLVCGSVASVAAASRLTWSFARDRGLPFWGALGKLNTDTTIPAWAIAITACISILLSFVTLGSVVVFNDLISLTVSALYLSYLICCSLLLWRRCTGKIRTAAELTRSMGPGHLAWGRWRIPGFLGIANNLVACIYLTVLGFFSFWPTATPVESPASMNFAVVMFSAVLIFSLVWYYLGARKDYQGPIVETEEIWEGSAIQSFRTQES